MYNLTIRILITTNGEHYQVHNCNVERHEEWTQTSQVEDIIYHSWPDSIVRIMYDISHFWEMSPNFNVSDGLNFP